MRSLTKVAGSGRGPPGESLERYDPRYLCRRAVDVLGAEGPRSLCLRVLGETVYRRLLLMELWVDRPPVWIAADEKVEFGPLLPDQLDEYLHFRPDVDADGTRRRLARGHLCFIARRNGALVQSAWLAFDHAWIDYLGCELPLEANEAYAYDLFTDPAERGRQLYRAQVSEMFQFFSSDDQRARYFPGKGERRGQSWRLLVASHPEDRMWLLFTRLGARPVAVVGRIRLGRWSRSFQRRAPQIESLMAHVPAGRVRPKGAR